MLPIVDLDWGIYLAPPFIDGNLNKGETPATQHSDLFGDDEALLTPLTGTFPAYTFMIRLMETPYQSWDTYLTLTQIFPHIWNPCTIST
jgi:hypothetical protein